MTAHIAGFVTREQAGLRRPKSFSRNFTPGRGGTGVHYGGPRQPAADPGAAHSKCIAAWRGWQRYHMDTQGWADIAYTGGFCNHGFAFAGRGEGIRTGANGTNSGNQNWYAVVWIGGDGQTPTPAAIDALEWWIVTLRKAGAATAVRPHRWFKPTGCPGDPLVKHAARLDQLQINPTPTPTPTPEEDDDMPKPTMAWLRETKATKDKPDPPSHCYTIMGNVASWHPTHESINLSLFLGVTLHKEPLDPVWWKSLAIMNGPLKNT